MNKKHIAWGASNILWLYLERTVKPPLFKYCIDSFYKENEIHGLTVLRPHCLEKEDSQTLEEVSTRSEGTASANFA